MPNQCPFCHSPLKKIYSYEFSCNVKDCCYYFYPYSYAKHRKIIDNHSIDYYPEENLIHYIAYHKFFTIPCYSVEEFVKYCQPNRLKNLMAFL